ncbi:hypothetical protein TruAng_008970 [Truncatella angustata]|nr:hypothetical protein TruAng_008970 [Truncatella angustata]
MAFSEASSPGTRPRSQSYGRNLPALTVFFAQDPEKRASQGRWPGDLVIASSLEHAASEVYVTGTFDGWKKTEKLNKVGEHFEKQVQLDDASEKIYYKVRGHISYCCALCRFHPLCPTNPRIALLDLVLDPNLNLNLDLDLDLDLGAGAQHGISL